MSHGIALVVDDEPGVRSYIASILQLAHYQALEAESAASGLAIAQRLGSCVDLIVSDVHMPDGEGAGLAKAVRQLLPEVPIILVSGCSEPDVRCDAFLQKPFPPEALLAAVQNAVIGRHNAA